MAKNDKYLVDKSKILSSIQFKELLQGKRIPMNDGASLIVGDKRFPMQGGSFNVVGLIDYIKPCDGNEKEWVLQTINRLIEHNEQLVKENNRLVNKYEHVPLKFKSTIKLKEYNYKDMWNDFRKIVIKQRKDINEGDKFPDWFKRNLDKVYTDVIKGMDNIEKSYRGIDLKFLEGKDK